MSRGSPTCGPFVFRASYIHKTLDEIGGDGLIDTIEKMR